MTRTFKAVITYRNEQGEIDGGIFPKTISFDENTNTAKVKTIDDNEILTVFDIVDYIPLHVSGKTYQERKNDLEDKAIQWSYAGGVHGWSYGELAEIEHFFRTNGKRYGLLEEFEENAIC